jgi:methionyl-tRNA formyltransferase
MLESSNGRLKLRLVFMGSPEFAVLPLQSLVLSGHQVKAVYTRPNKPAGRGRSPLAPPVKKTALSWSLPIIQVSSFKDPAVVEQLAHFQPEAIVVAAYGQILPQAVLDIPCYGCLNIHPSLLPKYRGAAPVTATLLAGDKFAGVSVMRLDAGLDTGPVFLRAQIPVLLHDTAGSLTPRLFQIGGQMLLEVLAGLPGGYLQPEPQNNSEASYTSEISKEAGQINWESSAVDIWRQVRAYQPWPEAYTFWRGKLLKIVEAAPLVAENPAEPGRVVAVLPSQKSTGAGFGVTAGDGILGVLQVQFEGKKAMAAEEFLRGQKDFMGTLLG